MRDSATGTVCNPSCGELDTLLQALHLLPCLQHCEALITFGGQPMTCKR